MSSQLMKLVILAVFCHLALAQAQPEQITCRGFIPTDVAYPTPYISPQDRAARCKALFSQYNSTGATNINFVGQNTYNNPCKVDCGLCVDAELPDEKDEANVLRTYPPHISLKDSVVKCESDEVEVYEQYMPDGVRCGPWHMCESNCCVAKPELFPNSKRLRQKLQENADNDKNTFSQIIPPEWTKPLTCPEEGFFQNPNDCHKFYRCFKAGARGFSRTLFDCKPKDLVFDAQLKVCVKDEEGASVCGVLAGESSLDDY